MAVLVRGKPFVEAPPPRIDPTLPGRWGLLSRWILKTAAQLEQEFAREGWSLNVQKGCEALASSILKAWGPLPGYPFGGVLWWKKKK